MKAVRFHYRPIRYLATRIAARRSPAFALSAAGCIALDDVEPPELPGPDWVRIQTSLSGICGSDLSAVTAHDSFTLEPFGAYPFTFGHENVGVVRELGSNVVGWKTGDRVIINPMLACEQRGLPLCGACERGEYGLCRHTSEGDIGRGPLIGYSPRTGGGWSAYFVAHQSQLRHASNLSDDVAVLTDPFASALRPVLLHPPAPDDVVLVIGAGTIGALLVKALRASGFKGEVNAIGRYAPQRELAERAGATRIFGTRAELFAWAAALPGAKQYKPTLAAPFIEGGPSLVYDTVGSQSSINEALSVTREAGRVVLVGAAARLHTDWTRVWYRQLSVTGVFAYGRAEFENTRRDIYDIAIDLMRRDSFEDLRMVTHQFSLSDYRQALRTALDKGGSGAIKVVFRP